MFNREYADALQCGPVGPLRITEGGLWWDVSPESAAAWHAVIGSASMGRQLRFQGGPSVEWPCVSTTGTYDGINLEHSLSVPYLSLRGEGGPSLAMILALMKCCLQIPIL